ncbi:hypothetical protein [Pelosinus propionicus]|uniref:Uncharacterized protein n=1 Tax=Pelosinus propionicus DSM 13327 TaxID=1123291 RepID=A0A1I4MSX6_9FIRM|nr:hypothetical protein [Pelosinus propionicus]SFM06156.1 hypothetical protein SAMN04490355_103715 [Pelosinus propionicus DSM 13327]
MSDDSTFVLTGLQLMIMGDVEADPPDGSIGFTRNSYWVEKKQATIVSETIPPVTSNKFADEKRKNLLMAICLKYPFWNDFRILNFLNKRSISMTMKELGDLRRECGIESKEEVCLELMRLYFNNEIELDKTQVQFIERLNPAFRDRNFLANRPGELLVYECVFFRRLNKMFYLHLVFDLFNGYAFGKISRRCSGEIGLKLLQEKIVPFYRSRGYEIHGILHSVKSTRDHWEAEEAKIKDSIVAMGIEWLEPKHEFGIIQCFQRDFLDHFFSNAEALDVPVLIIQPAFDRWMIKYNASCPFHQRRDLLGYTDELESTGRISLEAKCN